MGMMTLPPLEFAAEASILRAQFNVDGLSLKSTFSRVVGALPRTNVFKTSTWKCPASPCQAEVVRVLCGRDRHVGAKCLGSDGWCFLPFLLLLGSAGIIILQLVKHEDKILRWSPFPIRILLMVGQFDLHLSTMVQSWKASFLIPFGTNRTEKRSPRKNEFRQCLSTVPWKNCEA